MPIYNYINSVPETYISEETGRRITTRRHFDRPVHVTLDGFGNDTAISPEASRSRVTALTDLVEKQRYQLLEPGPSLTNETVLATSAPIRCRVNCYPITIRKHHVEQLDLVTVKDPATALEIALTAASAANRKDPNGELSCYLSNEKIEYPKLYAFPSGSSVPLGETKTRRQFSLAFSDHNAGCQTGYEQPLFISFDLPAEEGQMPEVNIEDFTKYQSSKSAWDSRSVSFRHEKEEMVRHMIMYKNGGGSMTIWRPTIDATTAPRAYGSASGAQTSKGQLQAQLSDPDEPERGSDLRWKGNVQIRYGRMLQSNPDGVWFILGDRDDYVPGSHTKDDYVVAIVPKDKVGATG